MKVRCKTNLDDYEREQWPEEFCCRPMVGDVVQSDSGQRLYIVTITHDIHDVNKYSRSLPSCMEPMLLIELHKSGAV